METSKLAALFCLSFTISFIAYVITIGVCWWFIGEIDSGNAPMLAGAIVFTIPVLLLWACAALTVERRLRGQNLQCLIAS